MKKLIFSLACLILLCNSCVDEIKLNIDKNETSIVVDGLISDSLQLQTIKVSNSAIIGVGNDNILTPITGATVNVVDNEGASFNFPEDENGQYTAMFQGEAGKSYSVEIDLADGKKIRSTPTILKPAPPVGNRSSEVFEVTTQAGSGQPNIINGIRLLVDVDVSAQADRPFLRWRVDGEYQIIEAFPMALNPKSCYVRNRLDINLIKIFDTNTLEGGILRNESVLSTEYDYRFAVQYCFHILQYAISQEEYTYWNQIQDIINIDGNFFDPPPGTVIGNLYNPDDSEEQILGYFSVSGVSFGRFFQNANSTGVFVAERCNASPFRPQYPECRACETIINSSIIRPDYWII